MRHLFCILILSLFSSLATAQAPSPEMRADIVALLKNTGALEMGDQMAGAIITQMTTGLRAQKPDTPAVAFEIINDVVSKHINAFLNSQETLDGYVSLYSKHFTHAEINAISTFYTSDVGKKMVASQPALIAESMQLAQSKLPAIIPAMQQELMQRLTEAGITLP